MIIKQLLENRKKLIPIINNKNEFQIFISDIEMKKIIQNQGKIETCNQFGKKI